MPTPAALEHPRTVDLSFVVPAFNEAPLIGRTLDALHGAARSSGVTYEILVADDASDDDTAEVSARHDARVVPVKRRQIAGTRNDGARASRGRWIIFVDADTIVPAATLAATLEVLRAGVVAGGCACSFDAPLPAWVRRVEPLLMWIYRRARLTPGAYLFCTRAAFDAVGGFDESRYGGEEVVMARALDRYSRTVGRRFTVVPERIVTSGRRLRSYTAWELVKSMSRAIPSRGRRRESFESWYGPRRRDPGHEWRSS